MNKTRLGGLGVVESRFADLVWSNAPLTTSELVALCERELKWKRTTTYTVLKRLCARGIFRKNGKSVEYIISRDEYYSRQSAEYVDEQFEGSLPRFLAAFTSSKKISKKEADEIRRLIENAEE